MMKQLFIESNKKTSNEYVFIKALCQSLGMTEEKDFKIDCVGGKYNLSSRKDILEAQDTTNLIIFDANGDLEQSRNSILNQLQGARADIFLFPNNQDAGCFEDLLEKLATDKNPLECFDEFIKCLGEGYTIPNIKAKMYSYISVKIQGRNNINRGDWSFENANYWNLDCDYISPLKDFLKTSNT